MKHLVIAIAAVLTFNVFADDALTGAAADAHKKVEATAEGAATTTTATTEAAHKTAETAKDAGHKAHKKGKKAKKAAEDAVKH